jgi:hypothetical protein
MENNLMDNRNEINLFGLLDMNDDGEFELEDEIIGKVNITKLLESIHTSKTLVYVEIMRGNSLIFQEDGSVLKKKDKDGIMSFHICGANLDYILFYNTGEVLEITLKQRGNIRNNGYKS